MRLKIEVTALIIGLTSEALGYLAAWVPRLCDCAESITHFFRLGQLGFPLIRLAVLIGYVGLVLLLINLMLGATKVVVVENFWVCGFRDFCNAFLFVLMMRCAAPVSRQWKGYWQRNGADR